MQLSDTAPTGSGVRRLVGQQSLSNHADENDDASVYVSISHDLIHVDMCWHGEDVDMNKVSAMLMTIMTMPMIMAMVAPIIITAMVLLTNMATTTWTTSMGVIVTISLRVLAMLLVLTVCWCRRSWLFLVLMELWYCLLLLVVSLICCKLLMVRGWHKKMLDITNRIKHHIHASLGWLATIRRHTNYQRIRRTT